MISLNQKTTNRIVKGVKKFQPILLKAKESDINESDTVTIITDMLCEVFGYDKYTNITSEFPIKKTFCDLAVKLDNNKIPFLLECKAVGLELKDNFVRQATNYAVDSGLDWVVLTNGIKWQVYKVVFSKPVEKELVYEFDFCELNMKKQSHIEKLYYLCMEAFAKAGKSTLEDFHAQRQIMNGYIIGQLLLSDMVIDSARKQLKKLCPEIKVSSDEISDLIKTEILKQKIVDSEYAQRANKKVYKMTKALVVKTSKGNPKEV